ncbi:hypothetical protein [Herbaspirillum huttiense]|uniref:NTP pyrophosphohydrolase MazG putative catalytic core domain-containing protein n=1 Tax=Herbaspirillum huttiense subsp. lycopersici TaxID=3074428 RepID=A0ABU2EGT2_9BURK|nr:hypothetical protein [Herbaspirillum huttiense]MDR9847100.1 hypothetical protein [Herbaspirillum huttiense SE1]
MDSKTYIANALRTESVPSKLVINPLAFHSLLRIIVAASAVADQFKRAIYYVDPVTGQKKSPIDPAKLIESLIDLQDATQYLGQQAEQRGADSILNNVLVPEGLQAALADAPFHLRGMKLENINPRLLHAALGCFTESGELVEAVKKQFETGELDKVNFGEEVGDIEWYQAIGFHETGVAEADCREKNIAKLKKRYPEKFDATDAVVRDLAAERQILAGQPQAPSFGGSFSQQAVAQ